MLMAARGLNQLLHQFDYTKSAYQFKVIGWLKKYNTPLEAELHYCKPRRTTVHTSSTQTNIAVRSHATQAVCPVHSDGIPRAKQVHPMCARQCLL